MRKLLLIALLSLCACEIQEQLYFQSYQQFITKFQKKYKSMAEFMARYQVFKSNIKNIKKHRTWKEGITKFSDLTPQEFRKTYLNLDFSALATVNFKPVTVKRNPKPPKEFNWMDQKVLGEIKDQLSCGSCWAFAAMANIESQAFLKKNMTVRLSEQQMVDCDKYDSGCKGGLQENTFKWIKEHPGLMSEKDYPYTAWDDECQFDASKAIPGLEVVGFKKLGNCSETYCDVDEEDMRDFLLETGPLSIALNADQMQGYEGGIISGDEQSCDPDGINHAVALVGYGRDTWLQEEFWIGRNSWGENWGEEGYFRMKRGWGTCGINRYILSVLLK